jgi:hypothetical protein
LPTTSGFSTIVLSLLVYLARPIRARSRRGPCEENLGAWRRRGGGGGHAGGGRRWGAEGARAGARPVGSNEDARRESRMGVGMKFQTVDGGCGTRVSIESMEESSLFIRGSGVAGGILTERGTLL